MMDTLDMQQNIYLECNIVDLEKNNLLDTIIEKMMNEI
jgi:hypothetical protein